MFAAFLSTILFSISVVCGHRTAKIIGGVEANFWRLTVATLFLGIWAFVWGTGLGGESLPVFLISGLLGIGVGDAGLFQALPRLGPRLSLLLIQCLTAPIAAVTEFLWMHTALGMIQVLCIVVILAGVAVGLAPSEHLHIPRRQLVVGIIFALIGTAGNAVGAVISRRGYALVHENGQTLDGGTAAFQRIIGGLLVAGILLLIAKRQFVRLPENAGAALDTSSTRAKWRRIWPWVLMNSLAGQTVGVSCLQWALETTPTGIVMSIVALTPLTVIPLTRVVEGEKVTPRAVIGGAIAVAGVVGLTLTK